MLTDEKIVEIYSKVAPAWHKGPSTMDTELARAIEAEVLKDAPACAGIWLWRNQRYDVSVSALAEGWYQRNGIERYFGPIPADTGSKT